MSTHFDCFLCYAKEDLQQVQLIYAEMRGSGLNPWMDKPPKPFEMDGLQPGDDWQLVIKEKIKSSSHFIPFFSKHSTGKRGFVQREFRMALDLVSEMPMGEIFIIPVFLEKCEPPSTRVGSADFSQFDWYFHCDEGSKRLITSLNKRIASLNAAKAIPPLEYRPSTAIELLNSIKTDSNLIIDNNFSLSEFDLKNRANISYEVAFDGTEIIIQNISNLTLSGVGDTLPVISVKPQYCNVLHFRDCSNVHLRGLSFGHLPEKGSCTGGVLLFENCKNVYIENCDLFGCGMEGLHLKNCKDVFITNTTIRECTYYAMSIFTSENVIFQNSKIINNEQFTGINVASSSNVKFDSCIFENNSFSADFFEVMDSWVHLFNCNFKDNKAQRFAKPFVTFHLRECSHDGNSWEPIKNNNSYADWHSND